MEKNYKILSGVTVQDAPYDAGLRAYMMSVYFHMSLGLFFTALVSYVVSLSPYLMKLVMSDSLLLMLGFLAGSIYIIKSMSNSNVTVSGSRARFFSLCALYALMLSPLWYLSGDLLLQSLVATSGTFIGMAVLGYTTKKDLSAMGSFAYMVLLGIIIASVFNFFFGNPVVYFFISVIAVIVFAGLIAYKHQKIREIYSSVAHDVQAVEKTAIFAALDLYLSFINLFLHLLRIISMLRRD